ncbi:MAG: isoprenylcysteine carboxylmethyltransferase family protein [Anaerolineae bacterium]|nr:isoprenylcysteine carboxylmethyltransferase family protein [Anaerolineae bacterium]
MFPLLPYPVEMLSPLWRFSPLIYLSGLLCLWLTRYTHQMAPKFGRGYYLISAVIRPLGILLIIVGWGAVFAAPYLHRMEFFGGPGPMAATYYLEVPLFAENIGLKIVGWIGAVASFIFFLWSVAHLGLRRSFLYRRLEDELVADGPYGLVRHPQFLASILICFFGSLIYSSYFAFVNVIAFAIALWVLSILEERELVTHFGEFYQDYAKRVPRLIPN